MYSGIPLNISSLSFLVVCMCFEDFSYALSNVYTCCMNVLCVRNCPLKHLLSIICICKVSRKLGAIKVNLEELRVSYHRYIYQVIYYEVLTSVN